MLDSLCLSPFRFGDTGKKKGNPFAFHVLSNGSNLFDGASGTQAVCSILGTRWVKRNGIIIPIGPNEIPVEDDGLRGCPAFTQYFLNNEAPVTQSITLVAGSYCLWIEGSGSATFNGLTATVGDPKVFTLASSFTGNCVIAGTVTKAMLNSGLFIAPFSPTQGVTKSFVTEAATATTGTSYDLDNALLARLKNNFRGSTVGMAERHNPSTDIAGYFNTNSTIETLTMLANARTTAWIPTEGFSIFEIVSNGSRSRVQCKKEGGTIFFLQDSATAPYRITIPAGYTYFRIYYEADISTNHTSTISIKPIQAQGHLELTFKGNVDQSFIGTNVFNILSVNNSIGSVLYYYPSPQGWRVYDGTNLLVLPGLPVSQSGLFKIVIDWGTHSTGPKMRITVNGVQSALANFSGSFGAQDLRFFFGNTVHAGWIVKDSLRVMDRPQW